MKVFRDSNCCSLMACRDVALQHLSIPMPRTNCRSIVFCITMLLYCRFHRVVYTSHLFILENLAVHLYVLPILQKTLPCICMHHQFRVETLQCNVFVLSIETLQCNVSTNVLHYIFPTRITSAKIPEAVTAAPAPAPFINKGWSI